MTKKLFKTDTESYKHLFTFLPEDKYQQIAPTEMKEQMNGVVR